MSKNSRNKKSKIVQAPQGTSKVEPKRELKPNMVIPPTGYSLPKDQRGPIMVAIPTGRHNINSGTVKSLFSAHPYLGHFDGVMFYSHAGSLVQIARQETLNLALEQGIRWLWFIDDDMSFQPDTPMRLVMDCIENDYALCSGLSIKRVPPFSPTVGMTCNEEGTPILTPELVPDSGVHEVSHSGLACTVIDLDKIREKKLNEEEKMFYLAVSEDNKTLCGEDLAFCNLLAQNDLKIGLDANIWTGHYGMHEFRPEMWFDGWKDMYLKQKEKTSKEEVKEEVNVG
jgi:hypothetical protein